MNDRDQESREVERLLEMMRLAKPSAELRERVTAAAREAWHEGKVEVPWRIGLGRLAVSAAAAVLIVSGANYFSNRSVAKWQPGRPVTAVVAPASDDNMPGLPYSPFMQHVVAARKTSQPDPLALLERIRELRRMPGFADTELQ